MLSWERANAAASLFSISKSFQHHKETQTAKPSWRDTTAAKQLLAWNPSLPAKDWDTHLSSTLLNGEDDVLRQRADAECNAIENTSGDVQTLSRTKTLPQLTSNRANQNSVNASCRNIWLDRETS